MKEPPKLLNSEAVQAHIAVWEAAESEWQRSRNPAAAQQWQRACQAILNEIQAANARFEEACQEFGVTTSGVPRD